MPRAAPAGLLALALAVRAGGADASLGKEQLDAEVSFGRFLAKAQTSESLTAEISFGRFLAKVKEMKKEGEGGEAKEQEDALEQTKAMIENFDNDDAWHPMTANETPEGVSLLQVRLAEKIRGDEEGADDDDDDDDE